MHCNSYAREWFRRSHRAIYRNAADQSDGDCGPDRYLHSDSNWHSTAELPVAEERNEHCERNFGDLHHLGDNHFG